MHKSCLYVPAHHQRALAKIPDIDCDCVILDLEDAVLPDAKIAARDSLCAFIAAPSAGEKYWLGRINHPATTWGMDDLTSLCRTRLNGIAVPKINHADELRAIKSFLPLGMDLWAMIETPTGVLHAPSIAAQANGIILGTSDLAKSLHLYPDDPLRPGLVTALSQSILAARALNIPIIDGVYPRIDDEDGLLVQSQQARSLGFHGKSAIHPKQIPIINTAFRPTEARLAEARGMIAAFEQAKATGQGVVLYQGRLVEQLDVDLARFDLGI